MSRVIPSSAFLAALLCVVASHLFLFPPRYAVSAMSLNRRVEPRPPSSSACTGTSGSIDPCTVTVNRPVGASRDSVLLDVHNGTRISVNDGLSCARSGVVSSCSVSPTSLTVAAGDEGFFYLIYNISSAEGMGTATATSIGFNGTLTSTVNVSTKKSPVVTPKGQALAKQPSTNYTQQFVVQNPSATSTTFDLSPGCSSTVTCGTTTPASPLTMVAGATDTVSVAYTTGSTGDSGIVTLRVAESGEPAVHDSGYVTSTFGYLRVSTAPTNNDDQDMARCGSMCFTGTYTKSTVPYISMDAPRSITVAYHGDRMAVRPFIAVDASLHAESPTLQQYWLQAKINWGAGWTNVTFLNGEQTLHFAPPATPTQSVRLAGQFDASSHATGAYPLQILVTAQYPTRAETFVDSTQHVLVINERNSNVAKGWEIAGVQHLGIQADGAALITDGSGSATYFAHCGSSCFTTPQGDFSQVKVTGTGGSTVYTRSYPDGSKMLFNNVGEAIAQIGRFPDTVSFAYDSLGRLVGVMDALHHSTGLYYGTFGLDSIKEPGLKPGSTGRVTKFTVGTDSTLQTITDPDAVNTKLRYDGRFRLSMIIDRRGDTTTYTYRTDSSWKLASIASPNVPTDIGGGSTSLQRPTQTFTPWQIASVPTALTATTPAMPVLTDSVHGTVTDPAGHTTHFTVDHWGQPLRTSGPLGVVTTITRSGLFAVRTVGPTGAVDSAAYNSSGLQVYNKPAGQSATTITYGALGMPTQIAVPGQPTETFKYGKYGADSLVSFVGADSSMHYYVDARGRDTMMVDFSGHTTTMHFDATFGNLDSTTAPGDRWIKKVFDRYGRDSLRMANGVPADTTTYDMMNRATRTAVPGLGAATNSYDAMFQTRVKDPKGNVYRVGVDALGRVTKRFDPADTLNRFTSYRYNLDGLLTSFTDRRGQRVDFAYDSLHRKLAKTGTGVVADSFSYNPTGTVTVGWNVTSRDSIFTNSIGLTDSVVTWVEPANKRFRRFYHRVSGTTLVDSIRLATTSPIVFADRGYTWNTGTGLLSKIGSTAPQANSAVPTYTNDLLDSTITWAGAVIDSLAYTSRHELDRSKFNVAAIDDQLERRYGYADSLGHLTDVSRPNGAAGELHDYFYNSAGELTGERVDSLEDGISCAFVLGSDDGYTCIPIQDFVRLHAFGFKYDSAGNRLESRDSVPNAVQIGTYTTGNRLTAWDGATYTRDLDGNDSIKTVGTQVTTYNWSADGRLASVTVGTVKLIYTYDAFGQLIQRSRSINGAPAVLERQFLWDQGQLLAELDSSATHRIAEYEYWPGTDQPYALFTGADSITATRFFAQDAMNNVTGVFTTTGVAQSLVYNAFGVVDSSHSSFGTLADTSRLRWKGLLYEGDSTRLYYVRNRWYDPRAGRFLSEDPSGLQGGLNVYVYGGDDPIGALDPDGLSEEDENSCTVVQLTIVDSANGTTTSTTLRLCSGDGSVIGQILNYAAKQGVGDGSASWGGGVFATTDVIGATPINGNPSCSSVRFIGNAGEIAVQTSPAGRIMWGIDIYDPSGYAGFWLAIDYINGKHVNEYLRPYPPHGSMPASKAPSGAIFSLEVLGIDKFGREYESVPNACVVP